MKIKQLLEFCDSLNDNTKNYYIMMDPMGDKNRLL